MMVKNLLLGMSVGFPLLAGLYLLLFKPQRVEIQRRAAALGLAGAGLASLARYLLSGQAGCTFRGGPESCLQIGLLALSVILLNGLSLYLCLTRDANRMNDYQFFPLVNAAWAGSALANNWVISLACLSLTLIAISRWIWNRGASVGILVGRDDYKDDIGPPS